MVPCLVPFTATETPASGFRLSEPETTPLTNLPWPNLGNGKTQAKEKKTLPSN